MTIKPAGNRLLLDLEPAPASSKGGILLPENADKGPMLTALVKAVGLGTREDGDWIAPPFSVGQKVLVSAYSVNRIVNQDNLALVDADQVLATVEV